jgi:hypothetical protein
VLTIQGLRFVQDIEVAASVLDVAFCKDVMYISLDVNDRSWMMEYRDAGSGWEVIESESWAVTRREETPVELYWLEGMRKRTGQIDE